MSITQKQREMLQCAAADNGDITRAGAGQSGWYANGKKFADVTGETLHRQRLIDQVKKPGSASTARRGMGYHYRITDAGRAILATSTQPPEPPMPATQLTNRRNRNGVKDSCDQYRHFNGELFIAWLIYVTPERVGAYRAAGIRCRRIKGELYIHDDDKKLALDTDRANNFN